MAPAFTYAPILANISRAVFTGKISMVSNTIRDSLGIPFLSPFPPHTSARQREEPNVLECRVCTKIFSEQNRPRILPCSHTFCGRCIDVIILSQRKRCPLCREAFTANSTEDLLLNRIALDAAEQFSPMVKKPRISFEDFSNDLRENFIQKSIADCKKAESQIVGDVSVLRKMNSDVLQTDKIIVELQERLKEVEFLNKNTLSAIDENIKLLEEKSVVLQEAERRFKDCDTKLEAAVDFTSVGPIMDDSVDNLHNVQAKVLEVKELIMESRSEGQDIVKDMIKMQVGLRNVAEEMIERVEEDIPKVFLGKMLEGQWRMAPIKIESKNRIFLSHLEEGDTQVASYTIPMKNLTPKTSRRAFLDLGVGNRILGRIIIKVIDEGNLALNFLHMCAGDLGPSYANSSSFGTGCRGLLHESIGFGDYVVEDGTSARPVLSGVDWVRESKRDIYENTPSKEGDVRGWFTEGSTCIHVSRFYIVLRGHTSWTPRDRFGVVEEGLQVLKDAVSPYPYVKGIKIVNCGLVLREDQDS